MDEAFDVVQWIQEPQVIVGLAMAVTTPLAVPLLAYVENWLNKVSTSGKSRRTQSYKDEVFDTILLLWEGMYMFLIEYGCMKHSVAFNLVLVLAYSLCRSTFVLVVNMRRKKKEMAKQEFSEELQPVSIYTDMECGNFLKCSAMFVLQMMLYVMLLRWISEQSLLDSDEETKFFLAGAVVSTVMKTVSVGFNSGEVRPFWASYIFAPDGMYQRPHHYPRLRFFMSWLVNGFLNHAVFLMLPIVSLSADNDMEFVKDCMAVVFIAELDSFQQDPSPEHFLVPLNDTVQMEESPGPHPKELEVPAKELPEDCATPKLRSL